MPSLRFVTPDLHKRFLELVKALPFSVQVAPDGSVVCTEEQWPVVNGEAHKVRDARFEKWYFSWCDSAEGTKDKEEHLRSSGLRYELEQHEDRLVFLLPKSDEDKHHSPDDFSGPTICSFCNASHTDRQRFFASETAAICDECIKWLHSEIQSETAG